MHTIIILGHFYPFLWYRYIKRFNVFVRHSIRSYCNKWVPRDLISHDRYNFKVQFKYHSNYCWHWIFRIVRIFRVILLQYLTSFGRKLRSENLFKNNFIRKLPESNQIFTCVLIEDALQESFYLSIAKFSEFIITLLVTEIIMRG